MGKSITATGKKAPDKIPDKIPLSDKLILAKPSNPKCILVKKPATKYSYLKMFLVPIGKARGYGVYLRRNVPNPSWAENLMFDVVHGHIEVPSINDLNLNDLTFHLHQNDTPILHTNKSWGVKVYIGFANKLTREILLHIAQTIAEIINGTGELRESERVIVEPEGFLESMHASWSDYLGQEGARELAGIMLKADPEELGQKFLVNPEDFHCFWKTGQISKTMARSINLPPSMRNEIKDIDGSE